MSSSDQARLMEYLDNGGNIYLEGANALSAHEGTDFLRYFGVTLEDGGTSYSVETVYGLGSTFAENLEFDYAGGGDAHYKLDKINESDGELFFKSEENEAVGAYYDKRNYKTIITSPVIGAYENGEGLNQRSFLMAKYIEFFMGSDTGTGENIEINSSLQSRNYPNPFNPKTNIEFTIAEDSNVEISIYNAKGRKVRKLDDSYYQKGTHTKIWYGRDDKGNNVSSGIYFYKIKNGRYTSTKKMLLLK